MRRISMIVVALAVILGLSCVSLMADEDRDELAGSYNKLIEELGRQREENDSLREQVRRLTEEMFQLLVDQIERQREEIEILRDMLREQHNFMREMVKIDQEMKVRQIMGMRGEGLEWGRNREEPNIEMELRHMQEQVERNPRDPELRLKLGHIYREVDNIDAAFEQFKAAIELAPDFKPAYGALEELRAQFPDLSRRPAEKPLEDAAGTVLSANKEEIRLQIFEGDAMTFKVPFIQNEEGKWVLVEDFAHFAGSLKPGMRVKILWEKMEDRRIIRKIERIEDKE